MAIVATDSAHYADIAGAIREKNGQTALYKPAEMAAAIRAIQGGGGTAAAPVSPKDVNFYDYDGTRVAAYTLAEAQALTDLPEGPAHDGLVFQGWNRTLADIRSLTRPMNVGASYITGDGKTRLYIHIPDTVRSTVPLYFSQTAANGVTIDWGDGSPAETLPGTGNVNTTHLYAAEGDYVISLEAAEGCILGLGAGASSYCVMGKTETNGRVYNYMLRAVRIGAGVTGISNYAFQHCGMLEHITIPEGVTSLGNYAFYNCRLLASITIPKGVTSIGSYAFQSCYAMESITIPNGISMINMYTLQNCYGLTGVTIPEGVTSLGKYAISVNYSQTSITIPESVSRIADYGFAQCYGMAEYHIERAAPPTLEGSSVFSSMPADCVIYVPQGSLEAYQAATNWSALTSKMQEEPA